VPAAGDPATPRTSLPAIVTPSAEAASVMTMPPPPTPPITFSPIAAEPILVRTEMPSPPIPVIRFARTWQRSRPTGPSPGPSTIPEPVEVTGARATVAAASCERGSADVPGLPIEL